MRFNKHKKISALDMTFLFRKLCTLIQAGVPLTESCNIIASGHDKLRVRSLFYSIKKQLESGNTLAKSLRLHPLTFDKLTCQLIEMGERTGKLDKILSDIAHHKEKSHDLKKQIKKSLFYPAVIMATAMIITMIMLIWIVPQFAELFQNMQGKLPTFTLLVIHLSHAIREYFWLLSTLGILISTLFIFQLKHSRDFQYTLDKHLLILPLIGNFLKKIMYARFARNLAIIFSAGITITEGLKIIADTLGNRYGAHMILRAQKDILAGRTLYHTLKTQRFFPNIMLEMIKIGEESGTLDKMLERLANFYEAEIDHLVSTLSTLLEPLIMLVLGVLIGGLVIAMYLPIFRLGTLV